MAKWVLDTFEGTKVWYSADVIEKIKKACEQNEKDSFCYDCIYEGGIAKKVLQIIESEDNNGV